MVNGTGVLAFSSKIEVDMFIQFETGVPYIPPTDEAKKYVAPWAAKAKSSKK